MSMSDLFAKVILPLSLHDAFTYKVPPLFEKQIQPGQRVVVQFGQKKYYAALVISLTKKKPGAFEAKEVLQVLDEQPVVLPGNFELWNWISKYYCCTLGDVFRAALPSGLKMESKSKIYLTSEEFEGSLSEKERFLVQQLKQNVVSVVELQKTLGGNFSYPALKSLLKKKVVFIEERISSKYKPKTKLFVKFHPEIKTEDILNSKTGNLKKAKKQLALLYHFCH